MTKNMDVHFSSASNEWQTPRWLFDQLNAEFAFDTDLAATAANALCPRYYTAEMDALKQDWAKEEQSRRPIPTRPTDASARPSSATPLSRSSYPLR